jgi:hypothetical protein
MKKIIFRLGLFFCLFLIGCNTATPEPTLPAGSFQTVTDPDDTALPVSEPTPTLTASATATPYATIFDGFFYCRSDASTLSRALVTLRGQHVTLLALNQTRDWLYVMVEGFDKPCWLSISRLPDPDWEAVSRLPVMGISLTFTLPPATLTNDSNGGSSHPAARTLAPGDTQLPPTLKPPTLKPPTLTPKPPTPTPNYPHKECNDGKDNDGDGSIDLADPQCQNKGDDSESH